jgi:hypothetical protein
VHLGAQGVIRQKKKKKTVRFAATTPDAGAEAVGMGPAGPLTTTSGAAAGEAGAGSESEMEETLSDIDDEEIANYLHSSEEAQLKEVIWTAMNRDYLETQAAKALMEEEAAAAARAAGRDPDAEKAAEAERKLRRKRRRDQAAELGDPSESAAAAAKKMLATKKQLSSKINYDALANLFESTGYAPHGTHAMLWSSLWSHVTYRRC